MKKRVYFSRKETRASRKNPMADLLYTGLTIILLLASWAFIKACEGLKEGRK
jgi:hypothetical protein